jgi:hypothetical protein
MRDRTFGWSYPPGAEHDPSAPYNQTEDDMNAMETHTKCRYCGQDFTRVPPRLLSDSSYRARGLCDAECEFHQRRIDNETWQATAPRISGPAVMDPMTPGILSYSTDTAAVAMVLFLRLTAGDLRVVFEDEDGAGIEIGVGRELPVCDATAQALAEAFTRGIQQGVTDGRNMKTAEIQAALRDLFGVTK